MEKTYVCWLWKYALFNDIRLFIQMGAEEIKSLDTWKSKRSIHLISLKSPYKSTADWNNVSFFPRPPQLPPRPREVAMQVVEQKQSHAIDQRVLIIEKKIADVKPLLPLIKSK